MLFGGNGPPNIKGNWREKMKTKMLKQFFAFALSAFMLVSSVDGTTALASVNSGTEYTDNAVADMNESEITEVTAEEVTEENVPMEVLAEESVKKENYLAATVKPGTSQNAATAISVNTAYKAAMSKNTQTHWYKYTLSAPGLLELNFKSVSGTGYYNIYMNQNGDNYECSYNVKEGESVTERKIGLPAGTYYIKVYGSYSTTGKSYEFSLNFTSSTACETESNDTFSTADVIPVNTVITGASHTGNENDYYKFKLTKAGAVTLELTHDIISGRETMDEYNVHLYNAVTNNAILNMYSKGGETATKSVTMGLPAGEYYVLVYGGYHNPGTYGLKVNYSQSDLWEKEVNDTADIANAIAVNTTYTGTFHRYDNDYYRVDIANDGVVSFNIKHNSIVGLETANCYTLAFYSSRDMKNPLYRTYITGGATDTTSPEIGLSKGTYYVTMTYSSYTDMPYNLRVNYASSAYWEKEVNDSFTSATAITADKAYKGSIKNSVDEDYYKVNVASNGYVKLNLKHSATTTDSVYYIRFYNSDLNQVYYDRVVGTQNKYQTSAIGLKKGTYYVKISAVNTYTGTYELMVDATKASGWETEINNDKSAANKITVGKSVKGVNNGSYAGVTDSYDYYKFSLSKATYINVGVEHEKINGTSTLWAVHIYDSKGNYLDDFSASYMYVKESDEYSETKVTKLPKGTYYIKVYGHTEAADEQYKLTVNKIEKKAPTITSVESTQYNRMKVTWKPVAGATKYEIYRSTSKNGSYKKVATITDMSETSWTDKKVKTGTTYYYKMKSVIEANKTLKSGYSKAKSAKCVPAAPNVSLKSSKKNQMKVSWKKVSGASGYEVYRASSKKGKYTKVTTIKKGKTASYTDKKVKSGKKYYYKVRAYKTVGGKKVYSKYSEIESGKVK